MLYSTSVADAAVDLFALCQPLDKAAAQHESARNGYTPRSYLHPEIGQQSWPSSQPTFLPRPFESCNTHLDAYSNLISKACQVQLAVDSSRSDVMYKQSSPFLQDQRRRAVLPRCSVLDICLAHIPTYEMASWIISACQHSRMTILHTWLGLLALVTLIKARPVAKDDPVQRLSRKWRSGLLFE